MILSIKGTADAKALIDQVLLKKSDVYRQRVQVGVLGGGYGYYGEPIEREGNWLLFKNDTRFGMAEGLRKGESIIAYVYIRVDQIISLGFEVLEAKPEAVEKGKVKKK